MTVRPSQVVPLGLLLLAGACNAQNTIFADRFEQLPPGTTVTLQGQVTRNAALKDATVCLDLNDDGLCGAGEPTSQTNLDGRYSFTVTAGQAQNHRLIAIVKANVTTDANKPGQPVTQTDYVMQRPKGSQGGINPLTTLVVVGMDGGMAESAARTNVAQQLGIDAAKIDDYQGDPPANDDNVQDTARWIAAITSIALRDRIPLEVSNPAVAENASEVMDNLIWADSNNYFWRSLKSSARPVGDWESTVEDARARHISGAPQPDGGSATSLYRTAYLTQESGWVVCGRLSPQITTTGGNPSRSLYCGTSWNLTINRNEAVGGRRMEELVSNWALIPATNRINNDGTLTANLISTLGSATFPTGANEIARTNVTLSSDIIIDDTWRRGLPQTKGGNPNVTLQQVVDNYPVSGVDSTNGSLFGQTTLSLGYGNTLSKAVRVAFGGSGTTTQYWECDIDSAGNFIAPLNCSSTTGLYTIEEVGDNHVKVMRFESRPQTPSNINYEVVYTEVDWSANAGDEWVFRAHATKPDWNSRFVRTMRLDGTAWQAMKGQLGL